MPFRQDLTLIAGEIALLLGGGIVVNTDGDLGRLLGFCTVGGALGGGAGLLIAIRSRIPVHEIARRWLSNIAAALILGPFFSCWLAAQSFAAPVPGPVVILGASSLCGFFGVGVLLSVRGLYRSWIKSKRRSLTRSSCKNKPNLP